MTTDQIPYLNVTWVKLYGSSTTSFPTATQQTTPTSIILTIPFSPLTFSHRGLYRCVATLNASTYFTEYTISVDCEYNITVTCAL